VPNPVTLERIGQIALNVQDIERAVRFYRDVLGLILLFRAPPGLAFFDCGGVRLMLSQTEGESDASGAETSGTNTPRADTSVLYYVVGDIAAAHTELSARGATLVGVPHLVAKLPDHDLWLAFFHDSEGNLMALMSEVRG